MKPLRVLHIINSLEQGGAELHLLSLFRAYDPAIIKPSIITLYPTTALAPHFESLGFPITSLGLNSFNDAGRGIAKLIGIISATKPDIIHTALLHSDFIGRIAAKLCGYNQIITALHSPVYSAEVMNANPQLRLWKLLVVRTFDWFTSRIIQTHFVGCSAYVMKAIQPALDLDPSYCNVIYNGVHLPHLNYKKQERKIVINVGRLVYQKGQCFVIEAMVDVIKEHPDVQLWIVGEGWNRENLQNLIDSLGLQNHVFLLGKRQGIWELLQVSTLFVFPSLYEAMPIAPLEAMACQLPIVATDISPHREIIDHGVQGILVPPQNPEALAQAMIELLKDPERCKRMGEAGRRRIAERFDIRVTVKQWEQLYEKLVSA